MLLAQLALAQVAEQPLHCAADGAIIGLAADKAYRVRLPADAPENPETWAVVDEAKTTGPVNSFTGSFVQVQPDDGSSYNEIYGVGSFGRIPGLDFAFEAAQSGVHTLWLRWTGGDTIGGGDSLYAVMRDGATDASNSLVCSCRSSTAASASSSPSGGSRGGAAGLLFFGLLFGLGELFDFLRTISRSASR